jgi:hypothetical protein
MKKLSVVMLLCLFGFNTYASVCTEPNDVDCFNLVLLNVAHDEKNPLLAPLAQPAKDDAEYAERMNTVGMNLWNAFKDGKVQASTSRSYLVFLWGIDVSIGELESYHREMKDSLGVAIKDDVNSVIEQLPRGKILHPAKLKKAKVTTAEAQKMMDEGAVILPTFETNDPGMPTAVFRVTVKGFDQSLQFPWKRLGDNPLALICQEDYRGVYPPGGVKGEDNKKGHGISSKVFELFQRPPQNYNMGKPIPVGFAPFTSL